MQEQLISFETAKLAKKVGFNVGCKSLFYYNGDEIFNDHEWFNGDDEYFIERPTQSLLQKWLRETHKIDVVIGSSYIGYNVVLWDRNVNKAHHVEPINIGEKYEDVLEIGLQKTLNLIDLNK